ncbi:AAA family ATPase [bacterium]|nr:MAG: AAA family ATPase [bacterium]
MPKPVIILVNGLPATGKTTIATKIAGHLQWPIFRKDDIKEQLADRLNEFNLESSHRLGLVSRVMLRYITEQLSRSNSNFIIDSNFSNGVQTDEFINMMKNARHRIIEVFLHTDGEVLYERFRDRIKDRHPIHLEHFQGFEDFRETISKGSLQPLSLDGIVIRVDTTDFSKLDESKLLEEIKNSLNNIYEHNSDWI